MNIYESKVIITELLYCEIPVEFKIVEELILDKEERFNIMKNDQKHYKNYVKPDKLVMNTLL